MSSHNQSSPDLAPILVIEGIDGSGKGTQAKHVQQALTNEGHNCTLLSFPQYEQTFFGKRIGDFLNGSFGSLNELNPFLVSLLYSGDRFESREKILDARKSSQLLILDRYVPSNIAHQSAKYSGEQRSELREWIEHIEYEIFSVPRPSEIILLDTPVQVSQDLIAKKEMRTYTDQAADLQEADVPYLDKVREVYLELARENPMWNIIPVSIGSEIRSIEEIGQDILKIARNLLTESTAAK
ncbi:nucleoside/nucleotide kinase family protein [Thalassoglobus polymorphus]|uniref:Thymidylate kinase n=1 Tax=Thalassoglobus polymorphus TaxID=2527994 RepID=A0A517QL81_9PLAN|nr:thymidylate kinase [Thalassoglobus polymorphus]QDT32398.1 Thymidylate kinase [Thalassoglobus polymorphus]